MWGFQGTAIDREDSRFRLVWPVRNRHALSGKARRRLCHPAARIEGPPLFDATGNYLGIVQKVSGQMTQDPSSRQERNRGRQLCACATHLMEALETLPATTDSVEIGASPRQPFPINPPDGPALQGGWGEPRSCPTVSGTQGFHDGGGLCLPGRWPPERRW